MPAAPVQALPALQQALKLQPRHPDYHRQMGHIQRRLGHLERARRHYQRCLELQPESLENHLRLIQLLKSQAQLEQAWQQVQQTLQRFPQQPQVLEIALDLALAVADRESAHALRQRATQVPLSPQGTLLCGYLDLQAGQYAAARQVFAELVKQQPGFWPGWNALAEAALCCFDGEAALQAFAQAFEQRHGPAWNQSLSKPQAQVSPLPEQISRFKLEHDRAQLLYLAQRQSLPPAAESLPELYAELLQTPGNPLNLSAAQRAQLQPLWNAPIHIRRFHWQGPVLNPNQDYPRLQADFLTAQPRLVYWDNFLTPAALQALWDFCLESTFWRDYYPQDGYLGAFLDDGFVSPLLLQLVHELRSALPVVFKDLPLRYLWAFKYSPESQGIRLHADQSYLNLNFWLTPDSANRDPAGGGLLVYDQIAPPQWRVRDYNSNQKQGLIQNLLQANQAQAYRVAYRQNRAILFDPRLFHRTDPLCFEPGYENHRINVTMLFGEELSERNQA